MSSARASARSTATATEEITAVQMTQGVVNSAASLFACHVPPPTATTVSAVDSSAPLESPLDQEVLNRALIVSDVKPSDHIRDLFSTLGDFTEYNEALFTNRPINEMATIHNKAVIWITNNSDEVRHWLGVNLHKNNLYTVLAVYGSSKNQKWISDIHPDMVIKREFLEELEILSAADLLDQLLALKESGYVHKSATGLIRPLGDALGRTT